MESGRRFIRIQKMLNNAMSLKGATQQQFN